jgi:hypothetical protein
MRTPLGLETSNFSPDSYMRPPEVASNTIGTDDILFMANTPQPIEYREIVTADGEVHDIPVAAYVEVDDQKLWIGVKQAEDQREPESVIVYEVEETVDGRGVLQSKRRFHSRDTALVYRGTKTNSHITLGRSHNKHEGWWRFDVRSGNSATITVSEASAPRVERFKPKPSTSRIAAATIAAVALAGPTIGVGYDVIQAGRADYSAGNDFREALAQDPTYPQEDVNDVATLMDHLQTGNRDAILAVAEEYAAENPDNIITPAQTQEHKKRINESNTNEGVIEVLDDFMELYGKDAVAFTSEEKLSGYSNGEPSIENFDLNEMSVDATKGIANAVVSAYGSLPKSVVENAEFARLEIATSNGTAAGVYTRAYTTEEVGKEIIALAATSNPAMRSGYASMAVLEGSGTNEWVALHELRHAKQSVDEIYAQPKSSGIVSMLTEVLNRWRGKAEFHSLYGANERTEEADADVFAAATSPSRTDRRGLAHPNAYRAYHSKANFNALGQLARLETGNGDGAAAWVLAHNERLMGEDALR